MRAVDPASSPGKDGDGGGPVGWDPRRGGEVVTELGGRTVHLLVQHGEGPPVVLLGGCAVPSYAFVEVVHRLPGRWVVSLDRPGLVRTPWPGTLPTLAEEVGTLVDLFAALGEPAVVVAHSMAGPHAEAAVAQSPGSVLGLVLVDASVELAPRRPGSGAGWLALARGALRVSRFPPFAMVGSLGQRVLVTMQSVRRGLTDARPDLVREIYRSPDAIASIIAENGAYAAQLWDLGQLQATTPWPGTPTLVLTAEQSGDSSMPVQQLLAERLGGRQLVVEGSKHLMMIDRPDAVVDAVLALGVTPAPQPEQVDE